MKRISLTAAALCLACAANAQVSIEAGAGVPLAYFTMSDLPTYDAGYVAAISASARLSISIDHVRVAAFLGSPFLQNVFGHQAATSPGEASLVALFSVSYRDGLPIGDVRLDWSAGIGFDIALLNADFSDYSANLQSLSFGPVVGASFEFPIWDFMYVAFGLDLFIGLVSAAPDDPSLGAVPVPGGEEYRGYASLSVDAIPFVAVGIRL